MSRRGCSVEGCDDIHYGKGLCQKHWRRVRKYGSTELPDRSDATRFAARVVKSDDGCWQWTAAKNDAGYGQMWIDSRIQYVHRWSYEQHVGPIPEGHFIDHICRNPSCVRPDHLRTVTPQENVQNHPGATRTSKTGRRGVYPYGDRFMVQVRRRHIGVFDTLEEAHAAAVAERNRLFTTNDIDRKGAA